jgi:hypothetical protein
VFPLLAVTLRFRPCYGHNIDIRLLAQFFPKCLQLQGSPTQRGLLAALLLRVVQGKINQDADLWRRKRHFRKNFRQRQEEVATPEAADGPARRLDPTLAAVGGAVEPLDPTPPAADVVLHAPVLSATSSVLPSIVTNPVASNTRPGAPVSNNSPLPSAPSHGRFILPSEKIEILSRKPTRAQVVQVTTNLLRDSCPYQPVDVVHHEDYLSFETLLMRQYVSQPFKIDECAQWKT